ncbi:MAG: hypothetical protein QOD80_92, partial [Verrucomicrobiota bacterium]
FMLGKNTAHRLLPFTGREFCQYFPHRRGQILDV